MEVNVATTSLGRRQTASISRMRGQRRRRSRGPRRRTRRRSRRWRRGGFGSLRRIAREETLREQFSEKVSELVLVQPFVAIVLAVRIAELAEIVFDGEKPLPEFVQPESCTSELSRRCETPSGALEYGGFLQEVSLVFGGTQTVRTHHIRSRPHVQGDPAPLRLLRRPPIGVDTWERLC